MTAATALPPTMPPDATDWAALTPHPRLLVDADGFDGLKRRIAAYSGAQDLFELVRRDADRALVATPPAYVDGPSFMLEDMRTAQGRILAGALTYRLTADRRYLDATRRELAALAALKDWGLRHFLDVAEAALACAVGLDWLYDDLSSEEHERLTRVIVDNALRPSLDVPSGGASWVTGDFNWNPVCHGSLTVAALAVAEREPELARRVVERAVANVPYAGATYAPDGAFPEGPSYWAYGTTFYVIMAEALRSALRTDCGLTAAPGFRESVNFIEQIVSPTGRDFDYADYHPRHAPTPVMLWYARELRRGDLAQTEAADVRRLAAAERSAEPSRSDGRRHLALALLWWDPTLTPARTEPPRKWVAGGASPMAIFRSAWGDRMASYVAMKGGTPDGSHAHMDVGGFVLEADGVRWAVDLGTEGYERMRAARIDLWNYTQDSSRWTVFRNGPEGHNILRFGGGRQAVGGFAPVRALPDEPNGSWSAVAELSSLYADKTRQVSRRISLHPDRTVTIADAWSAADAPVAVQWQWLTRAEVAVTPAGAVLRQDGQTLELRVLEPAGASMAVEDVSAARGPPDSPNPGLRRIVIHLATAAGSAGQLVIRAIPGSAAS